MDFFVYICKKVNKMKIVNRKAHYEYFVLKEFICGLKLVGSEVKSIRESDCIINDAFVYVKNNELFIKNMHIGKNKHSSYLNHDERRERTLLLNKKEINDINKHLQVPNLTIIPLEVFLIRNIFKVKIGICKGKKTWDKKNTIKEREAKIEMRNFI